MDVYGARVHHFAWFDACKDRPTRWRGRNWGSILSSQLEVSVVFICCKGEQAVWLNHDVSEWLPEFTDAFSTLDQAMLLQDGRPYQAGAEAAFWQIRRIRTATCQLYTYIYMYVYIYIYVYIYNNNNNISRSMLQRPGVAPQSSVPISFQKCHRCRRNLAALSRGLCWGFVSLMKSSWC